MITARTIGTNGRAGNQLFQVAFLLAQSKQRGVKIGWRKWEYAQYFQGDFSPTITPMAKTIIEPKFHYTPEFYDSLDWSQDWDFHGYFQSEKYWQGCEDEIRAAFAFKPEFLEAVTAKNPSNGRERIAIHVRRGDYVGNANYHQLTPLYYLSALERYFPDWRQCDLLFFSDDAAYVKLNFGCLPNAQFPQGSEIEDLALMTLCERHIIANSSFSWWGAWLSGSTQVVRPTNHFAGKLTGRCDIQDLYPTEWAAHTAERLDFNDTTFMYPVSHDSDDRVKNLALSFDYLRTNIDANFKVCEHSGDAFAWAEQFADYTQFNGAQFWRTHMLNNMARQSTTPFIVNMDADVVFPLAQLLEAVHALRNGAAVVYPYSGRFVRVQRNWFRALMDSLDVGILSGVRFPKLRPADMDSVGGCIFFDRKAFWQGGGENENMVSFTPDDRERFERFKKLGFNVVRIAGNLWHMEHYCGVDSGIRNPDYKAGQLEFAKVVGMNAEQLGRYVETWEWAKQAIEA